jgi:hypothetical protein
MVLTAAAVLVGSAVMLADPIFQGLAIALNRAREAADVLPALSMSMTQTTPTESPFLQLEGFVAAVHR